MKTLIVKQKRNDGVVKVWKVKPSQSPCTFGTARISHLNSIDDSLTPFEGVFQLTDNFWSYVDLNPSNINQHKTTKLNEKSKLDFEKSTLSFEVVEKDYNHLESFKNFSSSQNGKHEAQLFMLTYNTRFIRSEIVELGKNFKLSEVHPVIQIPSKNSATWIYEKFENYTVQQRTIKTDDISALNHFSTKNMVDEDTKKPIVIALSVSLFLILMAMVLPKHKQEMTTWQPKEAQRIVVDMESLKKRKVAKAQAVEIEKKDVQKQAGGAGKVSGLLKNLNVGRISSLVGKVSAGEAASKNVIVQNGLKAGSGPTGRALAALGSSNKEGKDWSSEGNGLGLAVSTAGKAGGKSLSGMGGLQAGKTGDGGVGLIEDEAEVSGGLDRDIIAEHIKRQIGHILACYERQLTAKKDLGGKVSVKFTISGSGSVETQNITETTMKDATVEGCILNRVAKWTFPAPNGGTKVIVTYPFLFKSTN